MHLADAFIQSDIAFQGTHLHSYQFMAWHQTLEGKELTLWR